MDITYLIASDICFKCRIVRSVCNFVFNGKNNSWKNYSRVAALLSTHLSSNANNHLLLKMILFMHLL